jgi:AAA ATPase-like protein
VTDNKRDVEVSGGKGVVVGDYNTVFQVFAQSPPSIASYIRSAQFRALVDDRTKEFVGREFVFDEIDRILTGSDFASGYVVIRGEPGIGKTAIAASLVARRAYVHHFNIAPENIRSPRQFLENVCAQLIARYELDYTTLPGQAGEDAGFLSELLVAAVERSRESGEPVVVVVDALDEAEDTGLASSANRLYLPRSLPEGVFFVVTTREEADYRLDVDNESEIWIRDEDPANREDVARYVEGFLGAHSDSMNARIAEWGLTQEVFVEMITTLSEGNFMYLVHVLPEIARGQLTQDERGGIGALPRGLQGYYKRHWRDMKDADADRFESHQRPVLCFLAISREPVTIPQLMEWTLLEPGDVQSVVREWREFLNEDPDADPATYRIYHRSFAEFLDEEENLRWYHDQIAERALAKIPGFLSRSE